MKNRHIDIKIADCYYVNMINIINETLSIGYKHVTDLNVVRESMKQIDTFRKHMADKKISVKKLLELSKSNQK